MSEKTFGFLYVGLLFLLNSFAIMPNHFLWANLVTLAATNIFFFIDGSLLVLIQRNRIDRAFIHTYTTTHTQIFIDPGHILSFLFFFNAIGVSLMEYSLSPHLDYRTGLY